MSEGARFDPQNGRLRLTNAAVRAIADLVSETTQSAPAALAELAEGGIVVDGGLHPRLVPLADCIARSSVRLTAESALPTQWSVHGWLDESIAVLLRSTSRQAGASDVVAVPRGLVPLNLAKLVKLAPRERVKVDAPVELDEGLLEALLGPGQGWTTSAIESMLLDDEILPEWLEILSDLSNQPKRRWRMGAWWNSPEESPAARLLEVVEADLGSFLVSHSRDPGRRYRRARLHPVTSTQIWRLLCALVPGPEQVERPLVD